MAICATCKNLQLLETGREFPDIVDTEYAYFRCGVYGWTTKEYYLMAPVPADLEPATATWCEFWEQWRPPETARDRQGASVGESDGLHDGEGEPEQGDAGQHEEH